MHYGCQQNIQERQVGYIEQVELSKRNQSTHRDKYTRVVRRDKGIEEAKTCLRDQMAQITLKDQVANQAKETNRTYKLKGPNNSRRSIRKGIAFFAWKFVKLKMPS